MTYHPVQTSANPFLHWGNEYGIVMVHGFTGTPKEMSTVLALDGFIFFGTANRLLVRLATRLASSGEAPLRQLIVDFRRVSGLDISASFSIRRMLRLAEKNDFRIALARVRPDLGRALAAAGLEPEGATGGRLRYFPDLDHALEWAEEETLRRHAGERVTSGGKLREQLASYIADAATLERFMAYLRPRDLAADETLIRQGDPPGGLFFLESGELSARLGAEEDEAIRLRTVSGPGAVLGEVAFYLRQPRSASVHAVRASRVFELDRESLSRMETDDPDVAAGFHRMMATLLSDRLVATNRLLQSWSESVRSGVTTPRCDTLTTMASQRTPRVLSERRVKWLLNLFPPWLVQGIRVLEMAPGFRRCRVRVRRSLLTGNLSGTTFGGTIFSAADPVHAVMYWQVFAHRGLRVQAWLRKRWKR